MTWRHVEMSASLAVEQTPIALANLLGFSALGKMMKTFFRLFLSLFRFLICLEN